MHGWRGVSRRLTACRTTDNPLPARPLHPRRRRAQRAAHAPARPRAVLACRGAARPPPSSAAGGVQPGHGEPRLCGGNCVARACPMVPWGRVSVDVPRSPGVLLDTRRAAIPSSAPRHPPAIVPTRPGGARLFSLVRPCQTRLAPPGFAARPRAPCCRGAAAWRPPPCLASPCAAAPRGSRGTGLPAA
jgi:hypothetical protein